MRGFIQGLHFSFIPSLSAIVCVVLLCIPSTSSPDDDPLDSLDIGGDLGQSKVDSNKISRYRVNVTSGNMIYQNLDLHIPGRGMDFVFTRTYNSSKSLTSLFSPGWTHSYDINLRLDEYVTDDERDTMEGCLDDCITDYDDCVEECLGGDQGEYLDCIDDECDPQLEGCQEDCEPAVIDAAIFKEGNGAESVSLPGSIPFWFPYRLEFSPLKKVYLKSGKIYTVGNHGIETIEDRNGNTISFEYASYTAYSYWFGDGWTPQTPYRLKKITDTVGREITLEYYDQSLEDLPPVPQWPDYYSIHRLISISLTNPATADVSCEYQYDSDYRLEKVLLPKNEFGV